ncbi:MAG: manganese efflux pump MntP family protein [Bacteroidales bacterium]|nr:manganese efflux pump MntP family protein [Bacteroidales bacterium]
MEFLIVFLIAISLSIDTFAISIASGLAYQEIKFFEACKIAITLAFFQTMMPLAGWAFGEQIKPYIEHIDHWIAFALLLLLGLKMIRESFKIKEQKTFNPLHPLTLLTIAIATSIDALAVGFTFSIIYVPIFIATIFIGFVTYLASMLGILIGKKILIKNTAWVDILGGIILIGIGSKILIEHLSL